MGTYYRVTATWEFGGGQLGPVDVEGVRGSYGLSERLDALSKALSMFRDPSSHGNVEHIAMRTVSQDERDELYMRHHPADGPGHLDRLCPCITGRVSLRLPDPTDNVAALIYEAQAMSEPDFEAWMGEDCYQKND